MDGRINNLDLEAKGQSANKCSHVIGGNKGYPAFGYTSRNKWVWALKLRSKEIWGHGGEGVARQL